MSWYKKAKLTDKSSHGKGEIFSSCQFCKRWATLNNIWKKEIELDIDRKKEC